MQEYESSYRSQISGKTREEAVNYLQDIEFYINMKDHLTSDDYSRLDALRNIITEVRDADGENR